MTSDGDGSRVVAVVRDLFFVARIRETARLAGVPLEFARTPEDLATALVSRPHFVLLDLTGGFDYARVFETVAAAETRRCWGSRRTWRRARRNPGTRGAGGW